MKYFFHGVSTISFESNYSKDTHFVSHSSMTALSIRYLGSFFSENFKKNTKKTVAESRFHGFTEFTLSICFGEITSLELAAPCLKRAEGYFFSKNQINTPESRFQGFECHFSDLIR